MGFLKQLFFGEPEKVPIKEIKIATKKRNTRKNSNTKVRTYKGPKFAQPGEVSGLFGYANYERGKVLDAPFSIIDIETSDLSQYQGHIIEIAVLQIDRKGKKLKEFSTLIRPPDGQVGATGIHGIRKNDLRGAPTFNQVVGNFLTIIRNSILVAHNARFEERFLKHELQRSGVKLPVLPALDTLWLSRKVIDLENYKLNTVVNGYGHNIINAHTALGDTRAVAKVLPKMLVRSEKIKYPVNIPTLPRVRSSTNLKQR